MSFTFISARMKIKLQYHSYEYWICIKTQKVFIISDATLWVELANGRHENFWLPLLRVASIESTRMYENLIEIKVKDMPPVIDNTCHKE